MLHASDRSGVKSICNSDSKEFALFPGDISCPNCMRLIVGILRQENPGASLRQLITEDRWPNELSGTPLYTDAQIAFAEEVRREVLRQLSHMTAPERTLWALEVLKTFGEPLPAAYAAQTGLIYTGYPHFSISDTDDRMVFACGNSFNSAYRATAICILMSHSKALAGTLRASINFAFPEPTDA